MSTTITDELIKKIDGLKYNEKQRRFILTVSYVDTALHIKLATHYTSQANAEEIIDRVSRQFYNNIYDEKTWPEDFAKKQYLILTTEEIVRLSRDIMLSHMESVILTRRDLLVLEHGVDLDGNKMIDDFDKNMAAYQFSVDTRRIFNQNRVLKYKERLNNKYIDPALIGVGY